MARIDREQLGEMLSGYIDGELGPREQQIIERVLREDESARQLLSDLRRTAKAVSSLPRHAAPSSILGDTQATLERSALLLDYPEPRAHQTRGRSSWIARLVMAAMVGLVVVSGWWFTTEQNRRPSKGNTEQAQREIRDADVAKEKGEVDTGIEKYAVARASRAKEGLTTPATTSTPAAIAAGGAGRSADAAVATVEQQLAVGVDPTSLRSHTFAGEPVRLQVTVRDRSEREALAAKVSAELSKQQLADLAAVPGTRADTTASAQRFYYRGKTGVNFEAANEDQILVRASPQQIDRLLTELGKPGMMGDSVAMVAGPIAVQGVEKSRSVVQLLGEQQQAGAFRSETIRNDLRFDAENGAMAEDDRSVDKSAVRNDGLVGGLLKIVGIDPKLLSTGADYTPESAPAADESANEVASPDSTLGTTTAVAVADSAKLKAPAEKGATALGTTTAKKATPSAVTNAPTLPPSPPPLVERRLRAVTESAHKSAGKDDRRPPGLETSEGNVTVVVQIMEQPKPVESDKPAKAK